MRRFLAAVLALSMLTIAGCSTGNNETKETTSGKQKAEQVVRVNIGTDPKTLDPGTSTGVPEANVQLHLWEGLMRLDENGRPVPGMAAEMPEVKDDGLTYVFKLRDAKWSNGDPVTAHDFVYAWQRALDPRVASEYAYQLYYVKGAYALNTVPLDVEGQKDKDGNPVPRPEAEVAADIEKAMAELGVRALDEKTLEVRLEAPTPYFLALTSFHTLYPLHKASVEQNPESWFRNPETLVGNGPFKLVSWTPKDKIILEKNPNYYDADQVKLDRIEYYLIDEETTATTMYESGQLDVVESGVSKTELDRLKKDRPEELKILPELGIYYYRFNTTIEPLNNPKVRKALSLAIDRAAITKFITKAGEMPAMALVPFGLPDADGDFRENGGNYFKDNDVETARALLAEAGYPNGEGFPKLTILHNTSEAHKKIAEAIQEMWKQNLGVEVEITNAEWQVYLDRQSNLDYQISRAGWLGDYVDPMTFIDMWVTDGGNNQTGWSNARYDELVQIAKTSGDQGERMQAMHEAEQILMEELPIMPIYFYVRPILVSPTVKGWSMPLTSGFNLRDAWIER